MQEVNSEHCNILTFGLNLTVQGHISVQVDRCRHVFFLRMLFSTILRVKFRDMVSTYKDACVIY